MSLMCKIPTSENFASLHPIATTTSHLPLSLHREDSSDWKHRWASQDVDDEV
jgi:hypothetical protein